MLLELRKSKDLSQVQLAEMAVCSQQLIGQIERGIIHHTKHIYRIAQALDVSPHQLDPEIPMLESMAPEPHGLGSSQVLEIPLDMDPMLLKTWIRLSCQARRKLVQFAVILAEE